jgi:hypothetical protein
MIPKGVVDICESILHNYGRQGMLVVQAQPRRDHIDTSFQMLCCGPADWPFMVGTVLVGIHDILKQQGVEASLEDIVEEALRVVRLENPTTTRITKISD